MAVATAASERETDVSLKGYFPRKEGGRVRQGEGEYIYLQSAGRSHSLTTLRHRSQSDFNPPRFKHLWLLLPTLVVGAAAAAFAVLVHSPIVGDHDGD